MWFGVLPMYPYFWRMNHSAAKRAKSYGGAQRVADAVPTPCVAQDFPTRSAGMGKGSGLPSPGDLTLGASERLNLFGRVPMDIAAKDQNAREFAVVVRYDATPVAA